MVLEGLTLLSLTLAVLSAVEAAPPTVQRSESCPCPGGGCVCLDREMCPGSAVRHTWTEPCSSPGQVCCGPPPSQDLEGRTRRQIGNDAFLDQCGLPSGSNELPWTVSIFLWLEDPDNKYDRLCSGVLIHPQVVLTSANCTLDLSDDMEQVVHAGEKGISQARLVTRSGPHEYFVDDTGEFDIAVLYLDAPFVLGEDVRVLCMPQMNSPLDTERCVSVHRSVDNGALQKTKMAIAEHVDVCVEMLSEEMQELYSFPEYSSFCAISRETSSSLCETDEGSSLMCPLALDPNRYALGGVVSLPLGCNDASQPIFYTNTTYFAAWLEVRLALVELDNFAIPP